ncbi:MAG: MFS transporter [Marinilabiliales bacterium]|nr:MFS transporter [Marinilabiliales bacterium]
MLVGLMGNISLGLSAFWLGLILIIPRLWDAFSDPIVGHLSDNTRSRLGRRRPYLLIGGIAGCGVLCRDVVDPQRRGGACLVPH